MFTQNYINFRKAMFLGKSGASGFVFKDIEGGDKYLVATSTYHLMSDIGYRMVKAYCDTITKYNSSSPESVQSGVYFGTGSTPATKNDYTLESPITGGLTITNPSGVVFVEEADGRFSYSATFTLKNETGQTMNIYEIGIFCPLHTDAGHYNCLMERQVFIEPITIPAGQAKVVTYKITFNQTLNVE